MDNLPGNGTIGSLPPLRQISNWSLSSECMRTSASPTIKTLLLFWKDPAPSLPFLLKARFSVYPLIVPLSFLLSLLSLVLAFQAVYGALWRNLRGGLFMFHGPSWSWFSVVRSKRSVPKNTACAIERDTVMKDNLKPVNWWVWFDLHEVVNKGQGEDFQRTQSTESFNFPRDQIHDCLRFNVHLNRNIQFNGSFDSFNQSSRKLGNFTMVGYDFRRETFLFDIKWY